MVDDDLGNVAVGWWIIYPEFEFIQPTSVLIH
jgi:hypothetical protein